MRAIEISNGFLPVKIFYLPGESALKSLCDEPWYGEGRGWCSRFTAKDGEPFVGLHINPDKAKDSDDLDQTVVHECVHAFQVVCEILHEDHPSMEFEAYAIMSYFKLVRRAYYKTNGKGASDT